MENKEKFPSIEKEGWNIKEIAEQATNELPDEILRKTLRKDGEKETADENDITGSVDSGETPQGREENKKIEGAAGQNG